MAEQQLFTPGTDFLNAYYAGKEMKRKNRLREVTGEAVTAKPDDRQALAAEAGALGGPEAVSDLTATWAKMDDQQRQNVVRTFEPVARGLDYIAQLDPSQQEQAYQQLLQSQEQQGLKVDKYKGIPFAQGKAMFESDFKPIEDVLGLGRKPGENAQIDYLRYLENGMTDAEKKRIRLNKGAGEHASNAALKYVEMTDAQGNKYQVALDPNAPAGTVLGTGETYGGGVRGRGGAQPAAAAPAQAQASEAQQPGMDVLPEGLDDQVIANAEKMIDMGLPDEAVHAYVTSQLKPRNEPPPPVGVAPATPAAAPANTVFAGQRPAEAEAGAVEAAKQEAQRQNDLRTNAPKAGAAAASRQAKTQMLNDSIDKAISQVNNWTAGPGSLLSAIPGTAATDLQATLDTIEANIGFDELQRMRDESPTGGALGQVTERELDLLQSVLAQIKASQSPAQLKENLGKVKAAAAGAMERARAAYRKQFGRDFDDGAPAAPAGAAPANNGFTIRRVR